MKLIKKIAKILFWIILVFTTLYSTFIIIQKLFWKDKTPTFMGYKNFIVLTGSMNPTINEGDIVIVKAEADIQKGDIIAFKAQNSIVTHRVVEIKKEADKDFYITKGDANSSTDIELISKEDIEGKYCFKIPILGNIILFFQKPIGAVVLFLILGTLLLLSLKPEKNN